ncbi:tRNA (guanosine(37)-N1)-methyltransferase TrmD [Sphingorhabdus sp. YGSMI21]|uniref:tRNA (guanosine(37)-N1)-methyltransferase TrmD n=1 Tax=Sphingorhabdus sp. YGSMI21 TaxID=2077182 RepID=UPI000C1E2AF8|nr:tRNA (guanosine(37)-N1)-methyltransferase TrmD [Sphingorhabdus sp. YGSMI21]ATW04786.1 tRNA (guanosine(37)-N1)-methyltransferase TrmD [Sphingorhabdus sp. YGSMI21]
MTFHAQILTLYPDMFPGPLGASLAGRALSEGKWACDTINPRDFATDKHRSVDDTPAGGGAGMVLRADIMAAAVDHAVERMAAKVRSSRAQSRYGLAASGVSTALETNGEGALDANGEELFSNSVRPEPAEGPNAAESDASTSSERTAPPPQVAPILAMTPRGKPLTQARVREIAAGPGVTIICGRFEGFDERLFEGRPIEEVSIGDYVLSGGEMGALVLLDACIRLLPGVMGASSSGDDESFEHGILEYPQYTRPQIWEGRIIPEVLRSGDHAKIAAWRKQRAEEDTRLRRPDLWERHRDAPDQSPSGAQEKDKDKE